MKHVIIGGVAGGATAAARIRRVDEFAQIVLLEKGPYISFANCGLPYYIGGVIDDREELFLQTPDSFGGRFDVDVRVGHEVTGIYPQAKTITVRRADGSQYSESYDKLLLSPGAEPVRPSLDGIDLEGIFTLRNVDDTDRIKHHLDDLRARQASEENGTASACEIEGERPVGGTVGERLRSTGCRPGREERYPNRPAPRVVVVGAGFIGLEMAENLHHAGAHVTIVEMGDQVMAHLDFSMAAQVHQHLLAKGVTLRLGRSVERFSREGSEGCATAVASAEDGPARVEAALGPRLAGRPAQPATAWGVAEGGEGDRIDVHLTGGEVIPADIVILSIGVRPSVSLAKAVGARIGETGGIWVDEYLQTSVKDVYAVGDAIEFPHPLTGRPWLNFLANPANRQGRIVADNMVLGNGIKYEGAIGTSIAKVFDLTVASTGLAAKRLKQSDMPYLSSWTHSASHAGYYPGALPLSIKLTFDPVSGKLYGGQCVGHEGVDKRIDQIALVVKHGGTVHDLAAVEHAYAPPYSSAKDPIAIAGYVAGNILSGAMPVITWREVRRQVQDAGQNASVCAVGDIAPSSLVSAGNEGRTGESRSGRETATRRQSFAPAAPTALILDVRTKGEFTRGHIPGSVNIPVDELRSRLAELPSDKPVIICCAVGQRGWLATRILLAHGHRDVRNLQGGYKTYSAAVSRLKA